MFQTEISLYTHKYIMDFKDFACETLGVLM